MILWHATLPYLMLKLIVQISLLLLSSNHIHHFAVFRHASRTFWVTVRVAFKAMLVEGMTTQEVDWRKLQGTGTDTTLGLLKDLGTGTVTESRRKNRRKNVFFLTEVEQLYYRQDTTVLHLAFSSSISWRILVVSSLYFRILCSSCSIWQLCFCSLLTR